MSKTSKKLDRNTIQRVLQLIRPYKGMVILTLTLALITVVTTLLAPVLAGRAVDKIVGAGQVDYQGLGRIALAMAATIACTALSQWLMNVVNNRITFQVVRDMRVRVFEQLEILPLKYMDAHRPGDAISRITTDVEQFSDGLLMGFTQLFTGVLTILGTLGVMLYIDWRIALVVVALTPLSIFVARFIATHTYSMFRVQSETRAEMTSLVEELIGNEHLVRAFGYEARAEERFDRINRDLQRCGVRATFFSSTTNPCTRFVNSLVYASVGILGAFVAIAGGITVGELSVFLNYANQYTKPFNDISDVMTELQNALACAQRVFDLIDETPIILYSAAASRKPRSPPRSQRSSPPPPRLPLPRGPQRWMCWPPPKVRTVMSTLPPRHIQARMPPRRRIFCLSIRSFTPRIPTLQAGCASTAPTLTTLWFRQTTVIICAAGLTDCIPPPERCFWMSAAALPRQTPPERPMP